MHGYRVCVLPFSGSSTRRTRTWCKVPPLELAAIVALPGRVERLQAGVILIEPLSAKALPVGTLLHHVPDPLPNEDHTNWNSARREMFGFGTPAEWD